MRWVEIIKISAAENRREALENQIKPLLETLNREEKVESVKLYHNILNGDLSIHLLWDNGEADPWGSKTGLCLAHLLKEFGLISHSVWVEKENWTGLH
jgi:hypothetical protein